MLLQLLTADTQFSSEGLVVLFVSHSSEEIQTVQLVENFHANSIAFLAGLGMVDFQ